MENLQNLFKTAQVLVLQKTGLDQFNPANYWQINNLNTIAKQADWFVFAPIYGHRAILTHCSQHIAATTPQVIQLMSSQG